MADQQAGLLGSDQKKPEGSSTKKVTEVVQEKETQVVVPPKQTAAHEVASQTDQPAEKVVKKGKSATNSKSRGVQPKKTQSALVMASPSVSMQSKSTETSFAIKVHKLTKTPDLAWKQMQDSLLCRHLSELPFYTPMDYKKVRFVCMSDTHCRLSSTFCRRVPFGDVLIHAGDSLFNGHVRELIEFNEFLGTLPHRYKLVVAGNHDICLDDKFLNPKKQHMYRNSWSARDERYRLEECSDLLREHRVTTARQLLTNAIYLQDTELTVYGVRIYGTPWTPIHTAMDQAFQRYRGRALLAKWKKIPENVDVLITHTPPLGYGDWSVRGDRAGCVELLSTVKNRVRPRYHVFGHIHEGHSVTTDGTTTFINCSILDHNYRPEYLPLMFDVPMPPGVRKSDDDVDVRQLRDEIQQRLDVIDRRLSTTASNIHKGGTADSTEDVLKGWFSSMSKLFCRLTGKEQKICDDLKKCQTADRVTSPISPGPQPAAEPAAKPAAEPAAKPAYKPAATSAATPATKPAAEPASKPAAEPEAEPVAGRAVELVTEPITEPLGEPEAVQTDQMINLEDVAVSAGSQSLLAAPTVRKKKSHLPHLRRRSEVKNKRENENKSAEHPDQQKPETDADKPKT